MEYKLKNIDPDDIQDLLCEVEKSFGIQFEGEELVHISTFGGLCNHITNKIDLENSEDCTSQQAFYKLRNAVSSTMQIDLSTISTNSQLCDFFPRKNRRSTIKKIEDNLGFKLNVLRPKHWISKSLFLLLLASTIGIFIKWKIGFIGLVIAIGGIKLANRFVEELNLQNVGQLAQKMSRENYLKSRRNPKTFNKNEIGKILVDLFSEKFNLDKSKLIREAEF